MKSEYTTSRFGDKDSQSDNQITQLLQNKLPSAEANPWFTPRVMNRLPERSRWRALSIWQWVFYILGIAGFIVIGFRSARWILHTDLTLTTLLNVTFVGLLAIICAGVIMTPTLIRIIREP